MNQEQFDELKEHKDELKEIFKLRQDVIEATQKIVKEQPVLESLSGYLDVINTYGLHAEIAFFVGLFIREFIAFMDIFVIWIRKVLLKDRRKYRSTKNDNPRNIKSEHIDNGKDRNVSRV